MKKVFSTVLAAVSLACLAGTITYDELAPSRPAGNIDDYWTTSSRPVLTLNSSAISAASSGRLSDSVSAPSTNALAKLDVRTTAVDESPGRNVTSAPFGTFLIIR